MGERGKKEDLFDWEGKASSNNGGKKEKQEGNSESRGPRESHGEPATPRPALLVVVVEVRRWLLKG